MGAVTPERVGWRTGTLKGPPLDLRLTSHHQPMLYAKAYDLSSPDGDLPLLGSVNCSRAA